jgi:parvulin-like peptidyl-prolyl isomerase
MSVEYQILLGFAVFFAAVYLVVFAVLKFSKAKKKPKLAKTLAAHWFFALISTAFVAIVAMFAYTQTKDLFANLLPSKQDGGKDVVFEIGGENVTTDEFYTELYKYYGDYSVYINLKRAIIDGSVESTTELKDLIKTKKTETIAYWTQLAEAYAQYGYTYDTIAKYYLNQSDYYSIDELDAYITELVKTDKMNFAYLDTHMDEYLTAFTTDKKPRVVSHILIAMDDPKKPTADEAARLQAVKDALAGGMSFKDAVVKYSEDSQTNQKEGLLGYMDKDTSYQAEFLAAALALNEGETSAWITTSYGYHLILRQTADLTALKTYDEFYYAILNANAKLPMKILWANAQALHVNFNGNTELETAIKKYLGLDEE